MPDKALDYGRPATMAPTSWIPHQEFVVRPHRGPAHIELASIRGEVLICPNSTNRKGVEVDKGVLKKVKLAGIVLTITATQLAVAFGAAGAANAEDVKERVCGLGLPLPSDFCRVN